MIRLIPKAKLNEIRGYYATRAGMFADADGDMVEYSAGDFIEVDAAGEPSATRTRADVERFYMEAPKRGRKPRAQEDARQMTVDEHINKNGGDEA